MSRYIEAKNQSKFNGLKYLEEYYFRIRNIEKFLLKFYHEAYKKINGKKLLEIGGGPVIIPLISASRKIDRIIFSEFLKENRDQIKKFVTNSKSYSFNIFNICIIISN